MARGGARANSGRKSKSRELLIERSRDAANNAKLTPLEYLLDLVQDTSRQEKVRFAAAVAAAPYVHPRLSNSTVTTTVKRSVDEYTTAELIAALEQEGDAAGASEAEARLGEPDSVH